MTYLLALAVADQALEKIDTVEAITRVRFTETRPITRIRIREEKRETPILRVMTDRVNLSESTIWKSDKLAQMMTSLGWRAGYKQKLGTYPLRRGFGNQIDRKSSVAGLYCRL